MRRHNHALILIGVLLIGGVLFVALLQPRLGNRGIGRIGSQGGNPLPTLASTPTAAPIQQMRLTGPNVDVSAVADKALPCVTGVASSLSPTKSFSAGGLPAILNPDKKMWSMGSGVIVNSNGYILTNQHVIGLSPTDIRVTLSDGRTLSASEAWSDPTLDLAIVKVNASGLPPATLGDADALKVGEVAVAIGNPLSLQFQRTVTSGIISALGRNVPVPNDDGNYMEGLIQTDASINPGNSGGPLLNSRGEVVGINTIKVNSAEGMGFAVPINVCKKVIDEFATKGSYQTPYLGLTAYDNSIAKAADPNFAYKSGILVGKVDPSSPAAIAGIKAGDVIVEFDGKPLNTMYELRRALYNCSPGTNCPVKYISNGQAKNATVSLAKRGLVNMGTR